MAPTQLTLPVGLRDDATFDNFYGEQHQQVLQSLQACIAQVGEPFIYLWGAPGVGRSHLLQACCHAVSAQGQTAIYLPLVEDPSLVPELLQGLEHMHLIAIDNVEMVLGDIVWEQALFHLYNAVRDANTCLVISGNQAAGQLPCALADLKSRLTWGLAFEVSALSDPAKLSALQSRAKQRGMHLSDDVGHYILHHYPRNMTDLLNILDQLDQASLTAKRRLTIPFIKEVLSLP